VACRRCGGLLAWLDYRDQEVRFVGARCLNCGDVLDATILRNRAARPTRGWMEIWRFSDGVESAYDARRP